MDVGDLVRSWSFTTKRDAVWNEESTTRNTLPSGAFIVSGQRWERTVFSTKNKQVDRLYSIYNETHRT